MNVYGEWIVRVCFQWPDNIGIGIGSANNHYKSKKKQSGSESVVWTFGILFFLEISHFFFILVNRNDNRFEEVENKSKVQIHITYEMKYINKMI